MATNIINKIITVPFYPFAVLYHKVYPKPKMPKDLTREEVKIKLDRHSKRRTQFIIGVGLITYYLIYRMIRKK